MQTQFQKCKLQQQQQKPLDPSSSGRLEMKPRVAKTNFQKCELRKK
jgi:hypothetical protein